MAAIANLGFFGYNLFQAYVRRLRFEIYVDNWIEVRNRCCDAKCQNPHLDLKCTLVAIGPKDKIEAFHLAKTELLCPSGLKVEVSPNNHVGTDGKFWGNQTPLVIAGGEKISFTVSYRPEMTVLKEGQYQITVRLAQLKGKKRTEIKSAIENLNISPEKLVEIVSKPCHVPVTLGIQQNA